MVKLKSEKIFGKIITFEKLSAKNEKGTFINAYFRGNLVGTGKTKTQAIKSISNKLLMRFG